MDKSEKKPKGKQRIAMEKAAFYLAHCEINEGLNPKKVQEAFQAVITWKRSFIEFMRFKENKQAIQKCEEKQLAFQKRMLVEMRPIATQVCKDHRHLLGRKGAAFLADSLFRMQYDIEARALGATIDDFSLSEENRAVTVGGLNPYWTREAGPVEWGHSLSDEEYLPRQFAEVPTGPEYIAEEDEHAHDWSLASEFGKNSDDEVVEDPDFGTHHKVDFEESNLKYAELLHDAILLIKDGKSPSIVLIRADSMEKMGVITSYQFYKLRDVSGLIMSRDKK